MTDYPLDMQLVVDPLNPENVVRGGAIYFYDPADTAGVAPIAIKDPSGLPLPNPLTSNAYGFIPPTIITIPKVKWKSGNFDGFFYSYDGLRNEAVAAKVAAEAAQAAAQAAAALVGAPADTAIAAAVNAPAGATRAALNATYAGLVQLAKNPDTLIAGAVTVDANNLVTSAAVSWPDGTPGTLTITSRDAVSAVLAYNITYGSPVTKTFTQPTITRNAAGAATLVPQIVVS